jgi:hypothetical protein
LEKKVNYGEGRKKVKNNLFIFLLFTLNLQYFTKKRAFRGNGTPLTIACHMKRDNNLF